MVNILHRSHSENKMDNLTYQTLIRLNPWLTKPGLWPEAIHKFLPLNYIPRALSLSFVPDKINLLIGPRQAGKSTLIWSLLSKLPEPVLFLNCEEPSIRNLCQSPALFLQETEQIGSHCKGFFFEEVQHLSEPGLFLKGIVDQKPGQFIVATGSASYHLRAKTRESLAGRAIRNLLLPFSLKELSASISGPPLVQKMEIERIYNQLLLWGGYPEVFLNENKKELLSQLVEAFVLRDASDMYTIKRPDAFRALLKLAASQAGDILNLSHYSEVLGISVSAVSQYINILEESHILKKVPPFVGGKRAEITSMPKIYFLDNGLRNFLFGGFAPFEQRTDKGKIMENFIFTELSKYINPLLDRIHFWRSKSQAEVDFVVIKEDKMIAIEVKATALKKVKISRSLRSFIQSYKPDKTIVINTSLREKATIDQHAIYFALPQDLIDMLKM
jgi:predicted AAA+ superfamily ATPase